MCSRVAEDIPRAHPQVSGIPSTCQTGFDTTSTTIAQRPSLCNAGQHAHTLSRTRDSSGRNCVARNSHEFRYEDLRNSGTSDPALVAGFVRIRGANVLLGILTNPATLDSSPLRTALPRSAWRRLAERLAWRAAPFRV